MFQFRRFPTYDYLIHHMFPWLLMEGFPIRKSPDRSLFAAPRSLSQLITSFIGSWCQGIPLALLLAWPVVEANATHSASVHPHMGLAESSISLCCFSSSISSPLTLGFEMVLREIHKRNSFRFACFPDQLTEKSPIIIGSLVAELCRLFSNWNPLRWTFNLFTGNNLS